MNKTKIIIFGLFTLTNTLFGAIPDYTLTIRNTLKNRSIRIGLDPQYERIKCEKILNILTFPTAEKKEDMQKILLKIFEIKPKTSVTLTLPENMHGKELDLIIESVTDTRKEEEPALMNMYCYRIKLGSQKNINLDIKTNGELKANIPLKKVTRLPLNIPNPRWSHFDFNYPFKAFIEAFFEEADYTLTIRNTLKNRPIRIGLDPQYKRINCAEISRILSFPRKRGNKEAMQAILSKILEIRPGDSLKLTLPRDMKEMNLLLELIKNDEKEKEKSIMNMICYKVKFDKKNIALEIRKGPVAFELFEGKKILEKGSPKVLPMPNRFSPDFDFDDPFKAFGFK
ncbi:hypothetical protein E3J79_03885 [Candidatus Dependentiae bacterium]|nr:MAG: hypothetical protein E3J79_03885 [Candidatus Dependentiae bacterium]